PLQIAITIAAPDMGSFCNSRAPLVSLVGGSPQRCPDRQSRLFSLGILQRIRHAGLLVFLCEPRVESSAEVHIATVPTSSDDHAFLRLDVQDVALVGRGESEN